MGQKNYQIIFPRLIAFVIDFILIGFTIGTIDKWATTYVSNGKSFPIELVMFVFVPLGFFLYWASGLNLGKRLFGLQVVDVETGGPASIIQLLKRSLPFSLLVSFNILFLIPVFITQRTQGVHDMFAGTTVVRNDAAKKRGRKMAVINRGAFFGP